jgi:hypothetical protein
MRKTCIGKIIGLSIFVLIFHVSGFAQDSLLTDSGGNPLPDLLINRITVHLQNIPLLDALRNIERTGNFRLNYNEEILPQNKNVTVEINNKPVIFALRKILLGTSIDIAVTKNEEIVLVKFNYSEMHDNEIKYTISGFITDAESGEALLGTNLFIDELGSGVAANTYGFYSITIPEGYYTLRYSYMGYQAEEIFLSVFQNRELNIELDKKNLWLDTIIVASKTNSDFVASLDIGSIHLNPKKLENIPLLLGERDLLRTLQLLPGISYGREGDCGFYVRGGDPDQNLTLIDNAPVYNSFHSLGFFSVFNSDAIKDVNLYKGPAPPRYGGRLSSVLDINMKEGNLKEFGGSVALGLIFSRLTLQGPIIKDKSSFMISGRRTYLDVFKVFTADEEINKSALYFYDLNLKANYRFSYNDRLYLSGYMGTDKFGFTDAFYMNWGNKTATLRWNHLFSNKLFLNSSLIYSRFDHTTEAYDEDDSDEVVKIVSEVDDITLKEDFQLFLNANNTLNFGLHYIYHKFLPGQMSATGQDAFNFVVGKRNAHEVSLYGSQEFTVNERIKLDYGLRATLFSVQGEEDIFNMDDIEDMPYVEYHKNENTHYWRIEPRLSFRYQIDDLSSIKAGYSKNHQYIHMISNSTSGTPLDIWQPSSAKVKPQSAHQLSLGYYRNLSQTDYEFSIEAYYKYMDDLIDYKDGANLMLRTYFESELVFGAGRAYGIELFLKKNTGNLTGWIAYTLSRSERIFPDINSGQPYPSKYDRTHDFSAIVSYRVGKNWVFSANFLYSSGFNITIPYGRYNISDRTINAYTSRNAYRLPSYHRVDIGISYNNNSGGTLNFSVFNLYARKNTYTLQFRESSNNPGSIETVRLSLVSIVPSISYTQRF